MSIFSSFFPYGAGPYSLPAQRKMLPIQLPLAGKPTGRIKLKDNHPLRKHVIGFFPFTASQPFEELTGNFTLNSVASSSPHANKLEQTVDATSKVIWDYHGPWNTSYTIAWGVH